MRKILIFGNSGSGKSTLARRLCKQFGLAHLDLDTIAWRSNNHPIRTPLPESKQCIEDFFAQHNEWIVEGCYSDLLELLHDQANEMIFLDLPTELCVKNAEQRPWEPHKYKTKAEQDANLGMLIEWIQAYDSRTDTFSRSAHQTLFESFSGTKRRVIDNDQSSSSA